MAFVAIPQALAQDTGGTITDATSLQQAINNASAGGTVTLTQNITGVDQVITINKSLTLDLNGHKIEGAGGTVSSTTTGKTLIQVSGSSTILTIKGEGTISLSDTYDGHLYGIELMGWYDKVVLESGTINVTNSSTSTSALATGVYANYANDEVQQNGANIKVTAPTAYGIETNVYYDSNQQGQSIVTITSGTINVESTSSNAIGVYSGGVNIISGGTITTKAPLYAYGVEVRANSGNSNDTKRGELIVSGNANIEATTTTGSFAYGIVSQKNAVTSAKIDIQGGTISATSAKEEGYGVFSYGETNITGGTISGTASTSKAAGVVSADGTTTISNNANITAKASTYIVYGLWADAVNSSTYAGTLNVKGGTITVDGNDCSYAYGLYVNKTSDASAKASVAGGTFNVNSSRGTAFALGLTEGFNADYCAVSGGNFMLTTATGRESNRIVVDQTNYKGIPSISGGFYNVKPTVGVNTEKKVISIQETNANYANGYRYVVATPVASIGNTNYASLQDAVDAVADNGNIITLLEDVTSSYSLNIKGKTFTLDLGGKTFTSTALDGLTIDAANVTIKNGTINANAVNDQYALDIYNGSTVTVEENVILNATQPSSSCIFISNVGYDDVNKKEYLVPDKYNTVTISGGTFNSGTYCVAYYGTKNVINITGGSFNGNQCIGGNGTTGLNNNTVNISGGTFTATYNKEDGAAQGMYFPNNDNVTIDNCNITVKGEGQGIVVRAGTVTIDSDGDNDVVVTTEGKNSGTAGDASTTLASAAIIFDASANYPGLPDGSGVIVKGGKYTSANGVAAVQVVTNSDQNASDYMNISGGTFSSAVDEDYCKDGFVPTKTTDSEGNVTYGVETANDKNAIYYVNASDGANGTHHYITGSTVEITDGNYYSFNVPTDMEGKTVTYTRTFKNTNVQPWFVPFAINDITPYKDKVTFYEIMDEADVASGLPKYKPIDVKVVEANKPYFVSATETGSVSFTINDATIVNTNNPGSVSVTNNNSQTYTFQGVYSRKQSSETDKDWFAFSGGSFYAPDVTRGDYLNPFRFYMTITNNTGTSSPAKISMIFDDELTGIGRTGVSESRNEYWNVYDLQGHRVTNLSKGGIYIINGKKVLVK